MLVQAVAPTYSLLLLASAMVPCRPSLIGAEALTVRVLRLIALNTPPLITPAPALGVPATYRLVPSAMPIVAPATATLAPNVGKLPVPIFTTVTPAACPPHSGPQFSM